MAETKTETKQKATETNPFEAMTALNPESFQLGYEKIAENFAAFAEFQKGSMEAVMVSAGAFAKGVEKLTAEQAAFTKSAFEAGAANVKAATSAKSPQEAFDLNSEFVRGSFEKNLGQANKVAELWAETTKEAVEPLTVRYSEMVEKIQSFRA